MLLIVDDDDDNATWCCIFITTFHSFVERTCRTWSFAGTKVGGCTQTRHTYLKPGDGWRWSWQDLFLRIWTLKWELELLSEWLFAHCFEVWKVLGGGGLFLIWFRSWCVRLHRVVGWVFFDPLSVCLRLGIMVGLDMQMGRRSDAICDYWTFIYRLLHFTVVYLYIYYDIFLWFEYR